MAATTAGAVKAFLEGQGLGIAVYRDQAPNGAAKPYVTVVEALVVVPDGVSTAYTDRGVIETAQVSVWQQWKDPATGALTESPSLAAAVVSALDGAVLATHPQHVYGCRVADHRRLLEQENNVVHHPITLELVRNL